ncbi:hypothetical protein ACFPIJ_29085 [Dactylosporangium cerinum]|uniref:Uncharacterized protein n=1 Tax=Dactylosporangium cerinum TaxID=1434730 RepID=A0ABV9W3D8_9ACTN
MTGSAVLWTLPGNDTPSDLVLIEAPWDDPDLATGQALLERALATAKTLGADELGHVIDSPAQPPQVERHPERRIELLRRAGFTQARDGRRFQWLTGADVPAEDPWLRFRSLADLGPEPLIDLLATLLTGTADARLAADVQHHGARKAAELLLEETAELHHEPHWWEIGYDPDGSPAADRLSSAVHRSPGLADPHHHQSGRGTYTAEPISLTCTCCYPAGGVTSFAGTSQMQSAGLAGSSDSAVDAFGCRIASAHLRRRQNQPDAVKALFGGETSVDHRHHRSCPRPGSPPRPSRPSPPASAASTP